MTYPPGFGTGSDEGGRPQPDWSRAPSSNGVWGAPVATLADPAPYAGRGELGDTDGWPGHLPPPPPLRVRPTWDGIRATPATEPVDLGAPPKAKPAVIAAMVVGLVAMMALATGVVVMISHSHIRSNAGQSAAPAAATATTLVPATSTVAPTPSATPAATTRFSFDEQAKDWDITQDDTTLHADWVDGVDHPDCTAIDEEGKLASLGCQYAAEMVFRGEGGDLMITQFVMGMGTPDAATAAAVPGQVSGNDIVLRPGTYISDLSNGGTSQWLAEAQNNFLVVTIVTADSNVSEDTVNKYLNLRHNDMVSSLAVR